MRNVLAKVAKADGEMVAAYIRTVFAQTTPDGVRTQLENVAATLAPKPRRRDDAAGGRRRAHRVRRLPPRPLAQVWSTKPIELNKELKRRTDVVGIFPNTDSLLRLAACVLFEAHDEWQDTDRRYLSEGSMALLYPPPPVALPTPPTADQEVIETPELATA